VHQNWKALLEKNNVLIIISKLQQDLDIDDLVANLFIVAILYQRRNIALLNQSKTQSIGG
jgi:hypothetical protein